MDIEPRDPLAEKVLLVGWDAADWKVIHPLLDRGLMPNLEKMIGEGVSGNIATLHPVFSPMLWTSIATGKRPFKHGILGFVEPTPDGLHVRPVTSQSRKTKTLWNIFDQSGMRSNVVGWWPSYPAEKINGVMVSDQFHQVRDNGLHPENWPLAEANISPRSKYEELKQLRMHPTEVTPDLVFNFIPEPGRIDQEKDKGLFQFLKVFCECNSIHAAATHLMETTEWDFMAVYYDAIDHFSHGFMKYHPPRLDYVPEERFEIYQHVVTSAYVYHDMMLGRLRELAGPGATTIVMSDHGFQSDHLRPRHVPAEHAGPAIEHRDYGIFVMAGPATRQDELLFGLNLLDVAPTVLRLFGLPVGRDMDGRVIQEAFEEEPEVDFIDSWDRVGPALEEVLPGGPDQTTHEDTQQALQQLVDLGYIEELDANLEKQVASAANELQFNLARSYMDAGMLAEALPTLVRLHNESPSEYRYGIHLAFCLKGLGRVNDLEKLISKLNERRRLDAANALTKLSKYAALIRERQREIRERQADGADEGGDPVAVLSEQEKREFAELKSLTSINNLALDVFQGYIHLAKKEYSEGIRLLRDAIRRAGPRPALYALLADTFLRCRDLDSANEAIQKGLELDPNHAPLVLGQATVHYRRKENQQAADAARQAIGLRYFFPQAHYLLGSALHRLGDRAGAIEALLEAVQQNPNYALAHSRLAFLFQQQVDPLRSESHRTMALEARQVSRDQKRDDDSLIADLTIDPEKELQILPESRASGTGEITPGRLPILRDAPSRSMATPEDQDDGGWITIVSGLPRSGTSMMMQMLQAGGLEIFTDQERLPDEDNPRGYFELEAVKGLVTDNAFLRNAEDQVVKVVAQLIPYLPAELRYRVIFMDRDFDEIIASQRKMLERADSEQANMDDARMRLALSRNKLDAYKLLMEKGVPVMHVPYSAVVNNPTGAAARINRFLGCRLDETRMIAAVDGSLYRNRMSLEPTQGELP